MDKLYIVIPAYNEEESIEKVTRQWHEVAEKAGTGSRLLVVNDGSRDNTQNILEGLKSKLPFLEVVNKPNSGHGPSCLFGYLLSLERGADYVFQTDSDGQTKPEEFWQFWQKRQEASLLMGFRKIRMDGLARWVITRVLRMVLFLIFGVYVKDSNCPFRLMEAVSLKRHLAMIPKDFFLVNALLVVLYKQAGEKILWLNIEFLPRAGGVPSISLKKFFFLGFKIIKELSAFKHNFIFSKEQASWISTKS